jgi:4-hydroxy-3-polyprenylbenzoate decarboxylase
VNHEVGLHYQIHRGIASHHAEALQRGEPLKVNIFIGGAPAMTVAAVMPLPENVSELALAGMLAGHRIPMIRQRGELPVYAQADFCITGYLDPDRLLPEGPFGDHLGYYSLAHPFPVMKVTHVHHRRDAVWPFTVVGRPPQEDSMFGRFVHELTGDVLPKQLPGIRAVHAVDEAGVHPLLLAVGSERYVPYDRRRRSAELHTLAHALLGFGQLSLAKYVFLAAGEDAPRLDPHHTAAFLRHVLARVDWRHDLHFHTETTSDTLDYSAPGLNRGSKLVVPVAGPPRRILPDALQNTFEPRPSAVESAPEKLSLEEAIVERPEPSREELPAIRSGRIRLPGWLGCEKMAVAAPGILAVQAPRWQAEGPDGQDSILRRFAASFDAHDPINRFPLIVLVDDVRFATASLRNFLWVTFTKSDPASDIDGVAAFTHRKHWGCRGALVLDARAKPHHAPPLVEAPQITRRVDRLAEPGGPLHGIL